MKKFLIAVVVLAVLAAGWFFVSPLFIDEVVDEDFLASVPAMTDEQKTSMRSQIMAAAANAPDTAMNEDMPVSQPVRLASGQFIDADAVHKGSGDALLYRLADGNHLVRLENFRATNGPALVVYLAEHPGPLSASDVTEAGFVSLGELKGNVGNQNYAVPAGTDISRYQSVVIWCELFGVLFSPAALTPVAG